MNNIEYIRLSIELHLFFDRIMKEHSFFLETSFTEKNKDFKKIAQNYKQIFSDILTETIYLADGNISRDLLNSGEIVTKDTLQAERKTNDLTSSYIDVDITMRELNLRSGMINVTDELVYEISNLNRQTIPVIKELINFKNKILNDVLSCKMYTSNYPLLINHIMNEAKMYHMLLSRVESRRVFTEKELYEQELFWNNIMKEHAEFIRGLLDPSEDKLIDIADEYAEDYSFIIKSYNSNPVYLSKISLDETIKFQNFKITGEEGILNCKIKSIIIPLLADPVVREVNHFIRILKYINR